MGLLADLVETVSFQKAEAIGDGGGRLEHGRGPGAAMVADPELWGYAAVNYREKPATVSYEVLRDLCKRDTILAAVILTRLRQVKAFSRAKTTEELDKTNTTGFRVRAKSGSGDKGKATEAKEIELTKFVARCGREDIVPQEKSFGTFLWRFTNDRLQIDQPAAEIRVDRVGNPVEFYAIDGASIRVVEPSKREKMGFSYVQLYQGRPVATFKENELIFAPENVSTDMTVYGYGLSETEIAVKKVMAHLGIDETNLRQFQPGSNSSPPN